MGREAHPAVRLKSGDHAAITELIDSYWSDVHAVVRSIVSDHEYTEEVVHDVFLRVMNKIGEYDEQRSFRTWVRQIARNLAKDKYRRRKAKMRDIRLFTDLCMECLENEAVGFPEPEPPAHVEQPEELREQIEDIFDDLIPRYGDLLRIYYNEGLSLEECAARTGSSKGPTVQRYLRAQEEFRWRWHWKVHREVIAGCD